MKTIKLSLIGLFFLFCSVYAQTDSGQAFARLPGTAKGENVATFAGGCFWSLSEGLSELKGVNKVVAGYAGGNVRNPSYEQVCTKSTGHAESVQVYYDPKVISYVKLSEAFFYAHDPTTLNRQGPDEGPDYRSVAFFRTPEEKVILEAVIAKVNASHHYGSPIVTQVQPFKVIYPAEKYHQGYYRLHQDDPYISNVSKPKVQKLRKAMNAELKPEFQNKKAD